MRHAIDPTASMASSLPPSSRHFAAILAILRHPYPLEHPRVLHPHFRIRHRHRCWIPH